ncbi:hypothetical protein Tco_1147276, partial [Tanacetum coccineum]
ADDTIAFLQKHPPPVSWQGITTSVWRLGGSKRFSQSSERQKSTKRKNTLLRDYKSIGKSSVFVDNSIGEQNEELGGLITRFCDRSEKCGYLSYRRRSPLRDKSPPRYVGIGTKLEEAGVEVQLYDEALYTIVVVTVVVGHLLRPLDIGR